MTRHALLTLVGSISEGVWVGTGTVESLPCQLRGETWRCSCFAGLLRETHSLSTVAKRLLQAMLEHQ